MKSKKIIILFCVFGIIAALAWHTGSVFAENTCDPAYVAQSDNVFTVAPNGADDTENLQCAFGQAVTYGPGAEVHLLEGKYYTYQVLVKDFQGAFTGEGKEKSVIENLPNMIITQSGFLNQPPSDTNIWPMLFVFHGGDFSISDLAVHIVGDDCTIGWYVYQFGPLYEMNSAIVIVGDEANVKAERIHIQGEHMANAITGYNVVNGIIYVGFIGFDYGPDPIMGTFEVYNSTFNTIASAAPVVNIINSSVVISHNTFSDVFTATDGGDLADSSFEFSHNKVTDAFAAVDLYNSVNQADTGSSFLFKNNQISGYYGISLEQTFGDGNSCLILGNNVQNVDIYGVYLASGIHGCTVVGGDNANNVLNLGYDNILTGVNNMGTGIGPTISSFMKQKP